jgi:hypothetical protein
MMVVVRHVNARCPGGRVNFPALSIAGERFCGGPGAWCGRDGKGRRGWSRPEQN